MRRKSYINLTKMIKLPMVAQAASKAPQEQNGLENISNKESKSLSRALRHLHKMSDDELKALLAADDDYVLDCLVNQTPLVKQLERERDDLKKEVKNLCAFNYAREPEYVRDRVKIREIVEDTASIRRRIVKSHLPLLDLLSKTHCQISLDARKYEEESEGMAQEFLSGNKSYDEFIRDYLEARMKATGKRALADRLAKEKNLLAGLNDLTKVNGTYSPIPKPRQRKKVSSKE